MSKPSRFWNRIAKKYAASPVPDEAIYQAKLKETQKYFNKDMDVLEFGCGTGSTAVIHASFVKSYKAIDFSEKMIEIAQEKLAAKEIDNLDFHISSFEDFSSKDAQYDVVLGLSILHLMDDPEATIQRVRQVLKPGGIFVSSTACINDFMSWFRFVAPIGSALGLIPKVQFFSRNDLLAMLEKNGFETIFELEKKKRDQATFLISRNTL